MTERLSNRADYERTQGEELPNSPATANVKDTMVTLQGCILTSLRATVHVFLLSTLVLTTAPGL